MFEPISTISNVAFILFGIFVFQRSKYVGVVTIVLGIASGGWHWTLNSLWHTFDFGMIYFMLLSLINYALDSQYTVIAFLSSLGLIGLHFILPSHLIISVIALVLFIALLQHYSTTRVLIIVSCFVLWISTNIPYLHKWDVAFWRLDVLHGISHLCAAIGISKVVRYKPATFYELTQAFKAKYLPSLDKLSRKELEWIIDSELNPVLGNQTVNSITQEDISRLLDHIAIKRGSLIRTMGMRSKFNQIFEFANGK